MDVEDRNLKDEEADAGINEENEEKDLNNVIVILKEEKTPLYQNESKEDDTETTPMEMGCASPSSSFLRDSNNYLGPEPASEEEFPSTSHTIFGPDTQDAEGFNFVERVKEFLSKKVPIFKDKDDDESCKSDQHQNSSNEIPQPDKSVSNAKDQPEKPFSCSYCIKSFSRKSHLVSHNRSHSFEKDFSCFHCTKSFPEKAQLVQHITIHTGEKHFSCPYCTKTFTYKADLIKHIRVHTGEKPFSCPCCNKSFSVKSTLAAHIRIHSGEKPFTCAICNKSFSDKSTLVKHIRIHSGEKPFSCLYCNKSFSRKSHLASHIKIHSGEKPFSCSYCDKSFKHNVSLVKHLKIHA